MSDDASGFLESLSPGMRGLVQSRVRVIHLRTGRTLTQPDAGDAVHFVLEGVLSVVADSDDGRKVFLRRLTAGDVHGAVRALGLADQAADIATEREARVLALDNETFRTCVESSPATAPWLARTLARDVQRLTDRLIQVTTQGARQRVHHELLRLVDADSAAGLKALAPRPNMAELAQLAGTTREMASREMRDLARRGLIHMSREAIDITDVESLRRHLGATPDRPGSNAEAPERPRED